MGRKISDKQAFANKAISRLIMRNFKISGSIPEKYWQLPKYKHFYSRELKMFLCLAKQHGHDLVYEAICDNSDIKSVAFDVTNLQYYISLIKEKKDRLGAPKDLRDTPTKTEEKFKDLYKPKKCYNSNRTPREILKNGKKEK